MTPPFPLLPPPYGVYLGELLTTKSKGYNPFKMRTFDNLEELLLACSADQDNRFPYATIIDQPNAWEIIDHADVVEQKVNDALEAEGSTHKIKLHVSTKQWGGGVADSPEIDFTIEDIERGGGKETHDILDI